MRIIELLEAIDTATEPSTELPKIHYGDYVYKKAAELGVDPMLAAHVVNKETGHIKDPELARKAVSPAGATGVMQLMPITQKHFKVKDPTDPYQNIDAGMNLLSQNLKKYGDPKTALAAYNWGGGNVDKWLAKGGDVSQLPKETQKYIADLGNNIKSGSTDIMSTIKNAPATVKNYIAKNYPSIDSFINSFKPSEPTAATDDQEEVTVIINGKKKKFKGKKQAQMAMQQAQQQGLDVQQA